MLSFLKISLAFGFIRVCHPILGQHNHRYHSVSMKNLDAGWDVFVPVMGTEGSDATELDEIKPLIGNLRRRLISKNELGSPWALSDAHRRCDVVYHYRELHG